MGVFVGFVLLFQILWFEVVDLNVGVGFELQVIVVVVIGGMSLMGGCGLVISMFFGVLIIFVLVVGLVQIGVNELIKWIIMGVVIVVVVVFDMYCSWCVCVWQKIDRIDQREMGNGDD